MYVKYTEDVFFMTKLCRLKGACLLVEKPQLSFKK